MTLITDFYQMPELQKRENFAKNDELAWKRALEEGFETPSREWQQSVTDSEANEQALSSQREKASDTLVTEGLSTKTVSQVTNTAANGSVVSFMKANKISPQVVVDQQPLTGIWLQQSHSPRTNAIKNPVAMNKPINPTNSTLNPENYSVLSTEKGNILLVRDYFKNTNDLAKWVEASLSKDLEAQDIRKIVINGTNFKLLNGRMVKEI